MKGVTPSWRETWWLVLTLPLGLTTWAAFLYAGSRTNRKDLLQVGAAYGIAMVAGFVMVGVGQKNGALANAGTALLIVVWLAGMFHAVWLRRTIGPRMALVNSPGLKRAQQELHRREYGRQLLKSNPSLARQLGVGRPDLAGSDSFDLIDVNHAGASALIRLPGFNEEHAQRVVRYRDAGGSFVSVEDMVLYLDLPATAIGPLRDIAVFDMGM